MLESEPFQTYTGFTGEEVKALGDEYSVDFESMKAWYYGYDLDGTELYCPQFVLMAIDRKTFSNDMVTFANKDDILTLLIHLGYLGYKSKKKTVYILNKEIYDEYVASIRIKGL